MILTVKGIKKELAVALLNVGFFGISQIILQKYFVSDGNKLIVYLIVLSVAILLALTSD